MGRTPLRVVSMLLTTLLALVVPEAASALTMPERARNAASYIAARQDPATGAVPGFSSIGSTADAILGWVAVGDGRTAIDAAMGYLRRQEKRDNVQGVGLLAKVTLAAKAAGANPWLRRVNLVSRISNSADVDGRYGSGTASVFDQALAILALQATAPAAVSTEAVAWLRQAQCRDGGWQYDEPPSPSEGPHCLDRADPADYFASDTNTTAYALMALSARHRVPRRDPIRFFDTLRDARHGGWGYTWGYRTTDANSTALVIQAYRAMRTRIPAGALRALRALQYACGSVAYSWSGPRTRTGPDIGATIGAVLGLLRLPLPFSGGVAGELPTSTCKT
jgi:hypothetical protein